MRITIVLLAAVMLIAGSVGAGPVAPSASNITGAWTFDTFAGTGSTSESGGVIESTPGYVAGYDALLYNWTASNISSNTHFLYTGNQAYTTAPGAGAQNNAGVSGIVDPTAAKLNFLPGTNTFSVNAWVADTSKTDGVFFGRTGSGGGSVRQYSFALTSGDLWVELGSDNSANYWKTSGQTLEDGNYHQITVVVPNTADGGEAGVKVYIDGTLSAMAQSGHYGSQSNPAPTGIMGRNNGGGGGHGLPDTGQPLNGVIDELTVFNTALTADNVGWLNQNSINSVIATPEPATMSLLILGGIGMIGGVIRRRKVA